MQAIAECCLNAAVDGVIISNTTISRPALHAHHAQETGGLSGAPLFELSTRQLARFYVLTKGKIPLVGVGGISNADHAWSKICAGASLLQLYSALVFQGPELVQEILAGLSRKLAEKNFATLSDAVGKLSRRQWLTKARSASSARKFPPRFSCPAAGPVHSQRP